MHHVAVERRAGAKVLRQEGPRAVTACKEADMAGAEGAGGKARGNKVMSMKEREERQIEGMID